MLAGILVGHTVAHDPAAAEKVSMAALGILFGGRFASKIPQLPINREWFDADAIDRFGFGLLFGASLVLLPWSDVLDVLMHWAGSGHAPGAH